MALPLLAEDLLQPLGDLSSAWFEDAKASINAWIADAVTQTTTIDDVVIREAAQKAWVYYRAYDFLHTEAVIAPAEQRTQETWDRWTEGQIRMLSKKAGDWQHKFFQLVNQGALGQNFVPVVPGYVESLSDPLLEID